MTRYRIFLAMSALAILAWASTGIGQENARDILLKDRPNESNTKPPEVPPAGPEKPPTLRRSSRSRRLSNHRVRPRKVPPPVGLGYTLFLKDDGGELVRVSPSSEFRSGQGVRLLVESNIDGYVYIFHRENDGPVKMLFPSWSDRRGENRVWAHEPLLVPAENEITFVGTPSFEVLTVVVSRKPIGGLPTGWLLQNQNRVVVSPIVFAEIARPGSSQEYESEPKREPITRREIERDVVLTKSDPAPDHVLLNEGRGETRLVAVLKLRHL
jgi:hypothetical protein